MPVFTFASVVAAIMLSGALSARIGIQTPAALAPTSTMTGVYTAAQATRGEETYMNVCVGCHSAGTHASSGFTRDWSGRRVAALFDYLQTTMPKDDPGSLTAAENAQLVAYLLKINRMPAGKAELPTDSAVLQSILIEFPPAKGLSTDAHGLRR